MTIDEIILQLESLKENSADFAGFEERNGQYNTIWHKDVEAIEGAIRLIKQVSKAHQ
jgi:hypothetical protein